MLNALFNFSVSFLFYWYYSTSSVVASLSKSAIFTYLDSALSLPAMAAVSITKTTTSQVKMEFLTIFQVLYVIHAQHIINSSHISRPK